MVVPLVAGAVARGAISAGTRKQASRGAGPSNVQLITREDQIRQQAKNLMFDPAANDDRYDSIDEKQRSTYANNTLGKQIKDDLTERRTRKNLEKNNLQRKQIQGGGRVSNFVDEGNQRQQQIQQLEKVRLNQLNSKKLKLKKQKKAVDGILRFSLIISSALYFIIQLPFALLYLASFVLQSNWIFSLITPKAMGPASLSVLLALVSINVFICTLLMWIADIKPFSGNGASLKIMAIVAVIAGTFTPVLNLFPLIPLWLLAVRKYPN